MFDLLDGQLVRYVVVVLSFLALSGLTANMTARREKINRRTRRLMLWVYGMFLYTAYGSGKAIHSDAPVTDVSYIAAFVLGGFLLALMWHPEGDEEHPPNDGSLGQWIFDKFEVAYNHLRDRQNKD